MNFSLVIGDDLEAALRTGIVAESRLELKLQRQVLRLRLNGEVLTGGIPGSPEEDECRYPVNFPVGAPPLRMGENRIEVSLTPWLSGVRLTCAENGSILPLVEGELQT